MSLTMLSSVYTGNNLSGTGRVFGVGSSSRYRRIPYDSMMNFGIFANLSSATVHRSSSADCHLIAFKPTAPWLFTSDYNGPFMQITNKKGAGSQLDVNKFSDHGFNDEATSLLLVTANKGFEARMSYRDLFLDKWKEKIDPMLGSDASRKGNPTLTWEMYPRNISYLDSNRRYLKIHQRLNINVPWWPDYDASITYHIYLFLDGAGHIKGHVARWAYWVEGGVKSGAIADKLEPKVISGMDELNKEIAKQLESFSAFVFKDLFYLPGNQTTAKNTGVFKGSTTDDVTIVVQL